MIRFTFFASFFMLAALIEQTAGQCFVTCQPGWGNNPEHLSTTTITQVESTRPAYAAGCGVNMYTNRGESASMTNNVVQQNARLMEFPWMAFVVYHYGTYLTIRSAVIMSNLWLITVANDPIINIDRLTDITVYFAHHKVLGNITENNGQFFMKVPVTNYFSDPKNSLALLRLPTPLGFQNWNVQPICFPTTSATCSSQCVPASRAMQSGWTIFFPDLETIIQKASVEVPSGRFMNTTFQLGAAIATVQFGRYSLCGLTGYDNTYISICDSVEWIAARQRATQTAPPETRRSNLPVCGVNGYQIASAHVPHSMGVDQQSRPTNIIQQGLVNEFPWQVGLNVYCNSHPDGSLCATCSGVVINNQWVLTTRTCFTGTVDNYNTYRLVTDIITDVNKVVIRFGAQDSPRISGMNRTQANIARNEYNMTVGRNAIYYDASRTFAMIKLPFQANFGNWTVQPICVPHESQCSRVCRPGTNVVLSGWKYEGGPLQKVTFQLPSQSGYLESSWGPHFTFGSPLGVQEFTYGQTVPPSLGISTEATPQYPGQFNALTLCGMVDGITGKYVTTCGFYCWMKDPTVTNVPQTC